LKKLLIILLFASCSPRVTSYEITGEMIQQPIEQVEIKEDKKDRFGRSLAIGIALLIYSMIFIR
jgi:hypothetical protein